MRINAGAFKGSTIITKDIAGTRPTSDKVKQAVFNILGPGIAGKTVLDLFCGFGALGLEALSRGAAQVAFVDSNPRCIRLLEQNLEKFKAAGQAVILCQEASGAIANLAKKAAVFDVVLCDAPYPKPGQAAGRSALILKELALSPIIRCDSIVIMQHSQKEELPPAEGDLGLLKTYRYGNSNLTVYRKRT